MWINTDKSEATDDNMAHAHCMLDNKATNTHSEYVILITFLLQQWLWEYALMLCCTYIACLVLPEEVCRVRLRNAF